MLVYRITYSAWDNIFHRYCKKAEFFISVKYLWLIHDLLSKKCGFIGFYVIYWEYTHIFLPQLIVIYFFKVYHGKVVHISPKNVSHYVFSFKFMWLNDIFQ